MITLLNGNFCVFFLEIFWFISFSVKIFINNNFSFLETQNLSKNFFSSFKTVLIYKNQHKKFERNNNKRIINKNKNTKTMAKLVSYPKQYSKKYYLLRVFIHKYKLVKDMLYLYLEKRGKTTLAWDGWRTWCPWSFEIAYFLMPLWFRSSRALKTGPAGCSRCTTWSRSRGWAWTTSTSFVKVKSFWLLHFTVGLVRRWVSWLLIQW